MSLPEICHGNINVIYWTYLLIYLFICSFIHSFDSIQFTYSLTDAMRSSKYVIKSNEYME